jgi:hypothetical protein
MRDNNISGILVIGIWLTCIIGWGMNIYKLTQCDFDTPLKAEVIRAVGIPVFPIGVIVGYMDIDDGRSK